MKAPTQSSVLLKDYIPRTDDCSSHTSRPAPYAIANDTFAALHPEEATWLEGRQDKTAVNIQSLWLASCRVRRSLPRKLASGSLWPTRAEGSAPQCYSLGVAGALFDLGVLVHAAYVSGLSGGGWYVMAQYLAMLEKTSVIDPATVLNDIKEQLYLSMFGDDFDANSIFTDVLGLSCITHPYVARRPPLTKFYVRRSLSYSPPSPSRTARPRQLNIGLERSRPKSSLRVSERSEGWTSPFLPSHPPNC